MGCHADRIYYLLNGRYRWYKLFNDRYCASKLNGESHTEFIVKMTREYMIPHVSTMRESKRRTLVALMSQEEFTLNNFGVADYSFKYHRSVLKHWKELENYNKSCHRLCK